MNMHVIAVVRGSGVPVAAAIVVICLALAGFVGISYVRGSDTGDVPTVPAEFAGGVPPVPPGFAASLVSCDNLSVPTEGERNTVLDPEHELLMMFLGEGEQEGPITVRYTEQSCVDHPVVGPIISHALESWQEDLSEQCDSLASELVSGVLESRRDEVLLGKLKAHLEQWC